MVDDGRSLASAALDAFHEGFVVYDVNGRILLWNRAAAALTGWSCDDVIGRRDPTIAEEDRDAFEAHLALAFSGAVPDENRTLLAPRLLADGRIVTVRAGGWQLLEAPGEEASVGVSLGVVADTSSRARDRLSHALVNALTEREVAQVVAAAVHDLVGCRHALVLQPCLDGTHLHVRSVLGDAETAAASVELDLAVPDAPWVGALDGDARTGPGLITHDGGAGEVLWVPMGAHRDRWVLALPLAATSAPAALRADAVAIANEAWVALNRAELVGDLEGQLEILTAITAVASTNVADLEATSARIARIASASLSSPLAGVYLADGGELRLLAAHGFDPADGVGVLAAVTVLNDGRELVLADPADLPAEPGPWGPDRGVGLVLGLPMRIAGRTVGVVIVARQAPATEYEALIQQVAASLAQQAALALGHARLLADEQETVRRLEELDQLKADWIAGMTHDLKAPLTGLLGFARTLRRHRDSIPDEDQATYLASMDRQATRMVAMVDDLLLAARMEEGHVEPARADLVNPAELLLEAVETFSPENRDRVRLHGMQVGGAIRGDRSQLLRVVTNLLDNALKYSPEDQPVDAWMGADEQQVWFRIEDRGPGIPEADRDKVFERYGRGDQGRRKGSTGLGLYIGRGIARGHGGDLLIGGAVDGGAALTLVLPVPARDRVGQS